MTQAPVVLVIGADVTGADIDRLTRRLRAALQRDPSAPAVCDVAAVGAPNLETVSALARLQAKARALGCPFQLINASQRLSDLVELAGLTAILPSLHERDPRDQRAGSSASDIGSPKSGKSASVSRNAVNSEICPPENSST